MENFCINTLLFHQKLAKFANAFRKTIGRRTKNFKSGGYHENIGNERKKLKNVEGFINIGE